MSAEMKVYEEKMLKTIEVVKANFAAVRAGRANAGVLDRITVDYYGAATPLNQVAAISSPDPRTLMIQPWDGSLLKAIEKAILTSDLGINPQNDGRVIRLAFPQLTEERRKDLTKQVRKYGEEGKVAMRNIRRDAMDEVKKKTKKSELTEDDQKLLEKELQELTDKRCKDIDALTAAKARHADVVMVDTAGRLQNKANLMNELNKISRVIDRECPEASRETLLVLDATTGQNGLIQAKEFSKTAGVSGIVLTKLDGTAKGGIVIAIAKELGVPVKFAGVGEGVDDLQPFDAAEFTQALL